MRTIYADCSAPIIRLPIEGESDALLMEDWHIADVANFTFCVPAGTETDGASIPRFLWRLCGHPLETPRVYAAMLHDWLYTGEANLTRMEADICYYFLLRHFGVGRFKAWVEYLALRLFGGSHFTTQPPPTPD